VHYFTSRFYRGRAASYYYVVEVIQATLARVAVVILNAKGQVTIPATGQDVAAMSTDQIMALLRGE
jgi:hypothetical protein